MRLIDADEMLLLYEGVDESLKVSLRVVKQNIKDMPTIEAEQTILELSNLLAEKDKIIKELSQIRTDIEAEPYIDFCEWVADTVLYKDFEDKWTLGAFAEVACRKLHKLGFVRKDGEYWTKDEVTE